MLMAFPTPETVRAQTWVTHRRRSLEARTGSRFTPFSSTTPWKKALAEFLYKLMLFLAVT